MASTLGVAAAGVKSFTVVMGVSAVVKSVAAVVGVAAWNAEAPLL